MTVGAEAASGSPGPFAAPPPDCPRCPRLAQYRAENRARDPAGHNGPVRSFGDPAARLLIVGLAPGRDGANHTGRPFTGDWAGDLLYETLGSFGFAAGPYAERADDGLRLLDCMVTNAVRCAPPANKPTPAEIATCRTFLIGRLDAMPRLDCVVLLGRIAHDSVVRACGAKLAAFPFGHGREHLMPYRDRTLRAFDSYHCSRYNTNTGVLTPDMFRAVFRRVREHLDSADLSPRRA